MQLQKAFLVGTHRFSFQAGKPAEILGVTFVASEGGETRPCYRICFEDGQQGYIAFSDKHFFEIIPEEDVRAGKIPEVVH